MFFIEAANINPDDYAWLVFKRQTKLKLSGYNQKHELRLARGDIFGVRRTRSNTYQLVKADSMHVLYRGISEKTHTSIMKHGMPYDGPPPTEDEVDEGFVRRRKVATHEKTIVANKRTNDYYRTPKARVLESYQIDLEDYQWRQLKESNIKVTTKKQGKVRALLNVGDFVGMRYMTPARGGYILYEGENRVLISHELYTEIVQASRPLPLAQQRTGIVELEGSPKIKEEPVKKLVRRVEKKAIPAPEPIASLYDLDNLTEEEVLGKIKRRSRTRTNLKRSVKKLLEVPEQETWVEDTEDEFEAETEEDNTAEEEEFEEEGEDTSTETPGDEVEDPEEDEEVDDDDDDASEEEEDDNSEQDQELLADAMDPGVIIRMKKGSGRRFVVVDAQIMERNENLMEYTLFDPDSEEDDDDSVMYHLRLGTTVTVGKFKDSAEIEGEYGEDELKSVQSRLEYATIKSMSLVK